MNKGIKTYAVGLLLALLVLLTFFTVNPLCASASVKKNEGKVIFNNAYVKITVKETALRASSVSTAENGYALDLEMTNKYKEPINVFMGYTNVNGWHCGNNFSMFGSVEMYEAYEDDHAVRLNKGATVTRTALIPYTNLTSRRIDKIKNLEGSLIITDTKGKTLLDETKGAYHIDLENDSSNNELVVGEDTGIRFDSKDKSSINGFVAVDVMKFYPKEDGAHSIDFSSQNTTGKKYVITASFSDGSMFFKYYIGSKSNSGSTYLGGASTSSKLNEAIEKKSVLPITYKLNEYGSETVIAKKTLNFDFDKIPVYDKDEKTPGIRFVYKGKDEYGSYVFYMGDEVPYCKLARSFGSNEIIPNKEITWSSSEEDVASIDANGNLTLGGITGGTVIRAVYKKQMYQTILEVREPSFTLNSCSITEGEAEEIEYSVHPDLEEKKSFKYTCDNENIAYVSGGKIYAETPGITKITATYTPQNGSAPMTAEAYVRVLAKKQPATGPAKEPVVIAPSLNANGMLFKEDNAFSLKLDSASMNGAYYCLNLTEECLGSQTVSSTINITSINGIKFSYSYHGHNKTLSSSEKVTPGTPKKHVLKIGPDIFSYIGTLEISEIRGTVSYYTQGSSTKTWPFVISPGQDNATSFVRRTPAGKDLHINFNDISAEVTSIFEYEESGKILAAVSMYIANKSDVAAYQFSASLDKINGQYVGKDLVFNVADKDRLYPGERIYARFKIPQDEYLKHKRKIDSLTISATIKGNDDTVAHDETITLDDLSGVSEKLEYLVIRASDVYNVYVGEKPIPLKVYVDDSHDPVANESLTWSTSDPAIATISGKGELTPLSEGSLVITATDEEGRMGATSLYVQPAAINYKEDSYEMYENTWDPIGPMIEMSPNRLDSVSFTSSDTTVATVGADGYIYSHKAGTATLTASYTGPDNKTVSDTLVVNVKKLASVMLSRNSVTVNLSSSSSFVTFRVTAVAPSNDLLTNVDWIVSDPSGLELKPAYLTDDYYPAGTNNPIQVKTSRPGTYTITASYNGMSATCTVTVNGAPGTSGDETDPAPGTPGDNSDETDKKPEGSPIETNIPVTVTGDTPDGATSPTTVKEGDKLTDPETKAEYTVTGDGGVRFDNPGSGRMTKVVIPEYVTVGDHKYPVTSIAAGAFLNNVTIKNVSIGKNIRKIEKKAFKGCKNLKSIKIYANSLKSVGKNAFKGCNKKVKVTVYAKNKKTYEKVVTKLKNAGLKSASFKFVKKK